MKVIFAGLKYDYGKAGSGLSFEYQNFYQVLAGMEGVQATGFFIDEKIQELGREAANQLLVKTVKETKPDLLFCFLFTNELKKETVEYITQKTPTKTFNWFADDHWRLPVYSRYWAPLYTAVGTTDSLAPEKYRRLGIKNVIKTQWAANTGLYRPIEDLKIEDCGITFVGKNYGRRGKYISGLRKRGLPARGYGKGWPASPASQGGDGGAVDFQTMVEIFSFSKINLNFTESYFSWPKQLAKLFIKKESGKYKPNFQFPISNFQSFVGAKRRQIKARTFEIPACGGFLLTGDADNLRDYYEDGKEIVIFQNQNDLTEKCKYYLEHQVERKAIAQAGYQRTIKEHTYELRFREIFNKMELM
jgi:spore maturation protein CgeB